MRQFRTLVLPTLIAEVRSESGRYPFTVISGAGNGMAAVGTQTKQADSWHDVSSGPEAERPFAEKPF
jgi:hypothetical protein